MVDDSNKNIRKLKVHCPRGCEEKPALYDLDNHLRDKCSERRRPCRYEWIGCKQEATGQELKDHEADAAEHLQLALTKINKLTDYIESCESCIDINQLDSSP